MATILAVDDEREFITMIQDYFEPRGYKVLVAMEGTLAVALARREKPAVALIDLKMPGMSGDEVLKELKTVSPRTKSIMITASEGEGRTREKLLELGAWASFDKPLSSLKDLEYSIEEAIRDHDGG